MFKKLKISSIQPNRFWMMSVMLCVVLLATACGSAAVTPANPTADLGNAAPNFASGCSFHPGSKTGGFFCQHARPGTLLTKDDVSRILRGIGPHG